MTLRGHGAGGMGLVFVGEYTKFSTTSSIYSTPIRIDLPIANFFYYTQLYK